MLLLFHLSDVHLHGTRTGNVVFDRLQHIARAAREMAIVREGTVTDLVVVLSGDIAFSGLAAEYALAKEMIELLTSALHEVFGVMPVFVIAPGNHDCDFSQPDELRAMAVSHVDPARVDDAIIGACTKVQSAFFEFRKEYAAPVRSEPLYERYEIELTSGHRLSCNVLNSGVDVETHGRTGVASFSDWARRRVQRFG